ncbi:MAG: AIM24 family protein [Methanobacterium sp.]|uniref:AIM24 family protein n=1 Tax=Methanobacterium sp. TaxID=2164 RepID=UPI003D6522BE|nr:AIM24 family protein [Methanobacterium sp.]
MNCPNCGVEVDADTKFCPECGSKIEVVETAAPEVVPEPVPAEVPAVAGGQTTTKYSIAQFVSKTSEKTGGNEVFELENAYLLDVNVNGKVWAKWGSMVSYIGDMKFRKESSLEGGIDKFLKKKMTGAGAHLMKAEGQGHLYLADYGKEIIILNLQNERLYVNGNDVLAFEETVSYDIKMMSGGGSMMSGGLFQIRFEGTGMVAITTHFTPLTIQVTPDKPIYTDPNATVAWSDGVVPEIKMDVGLGTLLGRSSGETFQMKFQGTGFVIVQPYEEIAGGLGQI